MSADAEPNRNEETVNQEEAAVFTVPVGHRLERILKPLASLKLTVALFLLGIFIVLAGTFAQVDADIWEVIQVYFRVDFSNVIVGEFPYLNWREFLVWIKPALFFPPSFFPKQPEFPAGLAWMKAIWPHGTPPFPDWFGIWFPKGWVIGLVMMANLLSAHCLRFKVQAQGTRLKAGWIILGLGSVLTFLVIAGGSSLEGLQSKPLLDYSTVWWLAQTTLFGLCAVTVYAAISAGSEHPEQRWLFGLLSVLLAAGSVAAFNWDARDEAAMRIMYQLIKATFAATVLLAGCIAVFKKRAGIVLLHAGIAMIMLYDVLVGVAHVESQMRIEEGQATSFSRDIREVELAVIRREGDNDQVTVVDDSLLRAGSTLSDPRLPFDIEILRYLRNSDLRPLRAFKPGEMPQNPATAGIGKRFIAEETRPASGTDSGGQVDIPSAYVKLKSKAGADLGTWLLTSFPDVVPGMLSDTQTVTVDGTPYEIALRFRRIYRDYAITLKDVQKNDYMGTDRPKDYSSYIQVDDPKRETSFEFRVWMNNPMRYAGETFYQSNYIPAGAMGTGSKEVTVLQVVSNQGWMTPYVACMIVAVGMLYQFGLTLLRFLNRRLRLLNAPPRETEETLVAAEESRRDWKGLVGIVLAAVLVLGTVGSFVRLAAPPRSKPGEFQVAEFGQLPMWYKGRSMPIDTFARNSLLQLSDRESCKDAEGRRHSAVEWLLDLMSDEEKARGYRVIRIENSEVQEAIGVEKREGLTYSIDDLYKNIDKIIEQAAAASKVNADERTLFQKKLLELANRIVFYSFLERTLGALPDLPQDENLQNRKDPQSLAARADQFFRYLRFARQDIQEFSRENRLGPLPLLVPTHFDAGERPQIDELQTKWEPLSLAHIYDQFYGEFPAKAPPAITHMIGMVEARAGGKVEEFNQHLAQYNELLKKHGGDDDLSPAKVAFEASYNRMNAFNVVSWLYVAAFVLAVFGWLFLPQIFQRSAFWLLVALAVIHTFALVGRIYISGRPPVTNLYSSAIFIGWAVVIGGLIVEGMTRLGVGNVVAAVAGFLTLRIAAGLAADGDTFVVLEAVLDTQFWLATHVVCITLGYATTYMAGLFGVVYLLFGALNSGRDPGDYIAKGLAGLFVVLASAAVGQYVGGQVPETVLSPGFAKTLGLLAGAAVGGTITTGGLLWGFNPKISQELTRMTYGILCFATFFSFVGTVLGGLWADDSWGRFWGWDPKENGALIIVLWNALVLHARWDGMVKGRGLALLAVLGNIVVSWSWFGVNELGVGLHSYGFTEGRLLMLALFVMSQMGVAAIGCLPASFWKSKTPSIAEAG